MQRIIGNLQHGAKVRGRGNFPHALQGVEIMFEIKNPMSYAGKIMSDII